MMKHNQEGVMSFCLRFHIHVSNLEIKEKYNNNSVVITALGHIQQQ
jgi:hypothetical protein